MKKLLALVLALVMSMSLVTISNAAFADAEDIDYTEAVEVMNAVGVLSGGDGNKFNPQAELTRAQACKIIAYLDLGEKVAEALPSVQVFSDVPASNWAAKYIAYCADAGYVSGVGDNKFDPDAKVTGYQFGKMLLCALGYDANVEQMTGANWQIAVAKLMEENDINDGVDKAASAVLTREEAAQYALNALKATTVEYDDKGTVIEGNGLTITTKAKKAESVYSGADYATAIYTGTAVNGKYTLELGEKLFKGELEMDNSSVSDDFYRPATVWTYDNEDIGTYAEAPVATFTGPVTEKEMFNVVKADKVDGSTTQAKIVAAYQDGYDSMAWVGSEIIVHKTGDDATKTVPFTGYGITSEIYESEDANGDEQYTIVAIRDYLGEVTKVNKADTKNEKDRSIVVTLATAPEAGASKICKEYETEEFAKDDLVVVNISRKDGKTVQSIKAVETVENVSISAKDTKANAIKNVIVANGVSYNLSQTATLTESIASLKLDKDSTYTLYLDSQGNVLDIEVYSESNTDYVQVIAVSSSEKDVDDFDSTKKYHSFKLLKMDGTTETVKAIATQSGETYTNAAAAAGFGVNYIYTVSEDKNNDGYVKFTAVTVADGLKANRVTASKLDKTQPIIASGIVANADTVFVLKTDDDTYKVYTGIANVPGYDLSTQIAYAVVDGGYAEVVFLDVSAGSASSSAADELVYLFSSTSSKANYDATNDLTYYVYDAVVDGEKTTIKSQSNNLGKSGLVTIEKYDSDGYVKEVAEANDTDLYASESLTKDSAGAGEDNVKYSAPTLKVGSSAYLTNDKTVAYIIDSDDDLTVGTAADLVGNDAGTMTLVYASDSDKTVVAIYFDGSID